MCFLNLGVKGLNHKIPQVLVTRPYKSSRGTAPCPCRLPGRWDWCTRPSCPWACGSRWRWRSALCTSGWAWTGRSTARTSLRPCPRPSPPWWRSAPARAWCRAPAAATHTRHTRRMRAGWEAQRDGHKNEGRKMEMMTMTTTDDWWW